MKYAIATWAIALILALPSAGAERPRLSPRLGSPAAGVDFRREVLPLLTRRCFACHGASLQKGGYRLDGREAALRGGDSGPAIVAGDAVGSHLVRLVSGAVRGKVMPPTGPRLTRAEVDLLRRWIDQGAGWGSETVKKPAAAQKTHWAFVAPRVPDVPSVRRRGWVRNPIDAFVLARLERERLTPSLEADRRTLVRRLYLDLLGLLPSPEEIDAFVRDPAADAYERLVDRLLASPHYGERWGRHWLDLARYADSDGYEKDSPRPFAYLYRDWVIDALNRDMPFDRFTIEQLAGDLLPNATLQQKIATGFHRNTLKNREGGIDPEEDRVKATVDRVSTTGTVWLGLTAACAECHTHKYDPITHREFYGLYAFFNSAKEVELLLPEQPEKKAPTLAETESPPSTNIHIRGDFLRKGEPVQPHTLAVLHPMQPAGPKPNRLDLARWLHDPVNPLTARVAVNRAWQHLLGRGLVATPDDFGTRGDRPSHPELLDWLARTFAGPSTGAQSPASSTHGSGLGWSQKALIRLIVTSATYGQSSANRADLKERDPRNVLLARQSRFRPEAEIVRDLYLAAGGLLNPAVGGPSIRPPLPADIAALGYAGSVKWPETTGPERYRRGMYIFFQRTVPYPMLATFDSPDSNVTCTRRERSNTPLQALTLLNDPVFVEAAQGLGAKLSGSRMETASERIRKAYMICLARDPAPAETARMLRLYDSLYRLAAANPQEATRLAGKGLGATSNPAAAAAWVGVARTVLNLDEFVTRE